MSEYIAKAPIEPRDYRVVFLTQKPSRFLLRKGFSFISLFSSIAFIRGRFSTVGPFYSSNGITAPSKVSLIYCLISSDFNTLTSA